MDIIAVLALGISIISMINWWRSKKRERKLEAAERRTVIILRIDKADQQVQTSISNISSFLERIENNPAFRDFVESTFQKTAYAKEWASVAEVHQSTLRELESNRKELEYCRNGLLSADDLPDPVAMEKTIPDAERALARLIRATEEIDRVLKNIRRMYDDFEEVTD